MSNLLEQLGLSAEELQNRVIDKAVEQLLTTVSVDDEGDEFSNTSEFGKRLNDLVKKRIDERVSAIAEKHVLPRVAEFIETLTLQQTNQWGEKQGKPVTFIEYLTQRCEAYMQEKVNYEGKSQAECGSYSFDGKQTRITYLIDKHLQYNIQTGIQNGLKPIFESISKGITETARIQFDQASKSMKICIEAKR